MNSDMEASGSGSESEQRRFAVPVDSENKATSLTKVILSAAAPHPRAFHLSWISFFSCFLSTFAAPSLMPVIRDNLNLTATNISRAGIASVSGAIIARLVMGTVCDIFGPRLASASLILLTAPAVFYTATASSPIAFILARFFTGISLSTFVSTQFWMSSMFSSSEVGVANATAAGWGNLGGGVAQLLMPYAVFGIQKLGATEFTAWRIVFFIPGLFQILTAYMVFFFGQDLPDGNFRQLQNSGERQRDKVSLILYHGIKNYRGWILAITYGYSFGVELTVDNIITEYFYDRFNLKLRIAGTVAAIFGIVNMVSRPAGGIFSDKIAKRFGMRGRLWSLWVVQTLGGLWCIALGQVESLSASVAVMIGFSFFVQAACGLTFGIVPFVSRRSLGLISGMTGAGGSVGAILTQLFFFSGSKYSKETGITLMGIMIIYCTLPMLLIYFPQWGGMVCGPSTQENATEEEYYGSEWNSEEREKGSHCTSMKFAESSRNERGRRVNTATTHSDVIPTTHV